jgi:DNA-binding NarL/FixJ family response regulator
MSHLVNLDERQEMRILLVDDNVQFLRVAAEFLQRNSGLAVVGSHGGGANTLTQAKNLQPQVILLSLDAPDLGGLETIPVLRNMLPGVGIIALALSDGSAYRRAALAAGADDLVCKEDLTTDLLPVILRVAQAREHALRAG